MMRRTLSLAMVTWLVSASPSLQALGLGEPQVESSLSEPLRARIALHDLNGMDPRQLRVRVADEAAFAQAGLSHGVLAERVNPVLSRENGQVMVTLSTEQPVNEPYLDILLSLVWPGGELQRQVTLLLDPPGYASIPALVGDGQAAKPSRRDPDRQATPARRTPLPSSNNRVLPRQIEVQPGDSLWGLANRISEQGGISLEQAMLALWQANPEAFPEGNMDNLRAGVTLDVPSRESFSARSTEEARRQLNTQQQAPQPGQDTPAEAEPENSPEPRLTLLSDAELAKERGEASSSDATPAGESGSAGQDTAQAGADSGTAPDETPAPAVQARRAERLDELEASWQASQEALAQVRQQRDQLADEVAALRQEMTELRDLLTTSPAGEAAVHASGQGASDQVQEQGLWQWLKEHLVMLGGGVVALLLALLAVLRRRDRAHAENHAGGTMTFPQTARKEADQVASSASLPGTPTPVASPVSERAPQAEAVNEADIFIAYGRYGQARELLEQSLASEPERDDLRLKLLSVYVELGERQAAEREARYLTSQGNPEHHREVQRLMARFDHVDDEPVNVTDERERPAVSSSTMNDQPRSAQAGHDVALEDHDQPEPTRPAADSGLGKNGEEADQPAVRPADDAERIIDYEPPSLEPSPSQRQDDLRQPSIEYPGSLDTAKPREAFPSSPDIGEPDWDVEEVAFEPLNLDNERPATDASRNSSQQ